MQEYLSGIVLGQQYVALDGCVISTDTASVDFDGWRHIISSSLFLKWRR